MQITIDDFIPVEGPKPKIETNEKEIICCSLSESYHWLRITAGETPEGFKEQISFTLEEEGLDYLYLSTKDKDDLIQSFDGEILYVPWEGGQ